MKKITRNEADFSKLFRFAEEISGVSWNNANDLFFDEGMIPYKGYADFLLEEVRYSLEEDGQELVPPPNTDNSSGGGWFRANSALAYQIIYQFMLKHEVDEMRVFGD
jgi:hypothetical protein